MKRTRQYVDGRQVVEPTVWDVVISRVVWTMAEGQVPGELMRGRIVRIGEGIANVIDDDGEEFETPLDNLYLDAPGWAWLLRSEDPQEEEGWG